MLLVLVLAGLAFLALFGAPVATDQLRPVTPPPADQGRVVVELYGTPPATPEEHASAAQPPAEPERAPSPNAARAHLAPIPDVMDVPEPFRAASWAYNEAVDKAASDMVALAQNAGDMAFWDAYRAYFDIKRDRDAAAEAFAAAIAMIEFRPGMLGKTSRSAPREWLALCDRTMLAIAVSHESWELAAMQCEDLARGRAYDPEWWDQEVYYLRKAGLRGRAWLAWRTMTPHFEAWTGKQ